MPLSEEVLIAISDATKDGKIEELKQLCMAIHKSTVSKGGRIDVMVGEFCAAVLDALDAIAWKEVLSRWQGVLREQHKRETRNQVGVLC